MVSCDFYFTLLGALSWKSGRRRPLEDAAGLCMGLGAGRSKGSQVDEVESMTQGCALRLSILFSLAFTERMLQTRPGVSYPAAMIPQV